MRVPLAWIAKSTMLVVPPTLNLVLLGFAMNPDVTDLRLGVVDESRTADSREVISAFSESRAFKGRRIINLKL